VEIFLTPKYFKKVYRVDFGQSDDAKRSFASKKQNLISPPTNYLQTGNYFVRRQKKYLGLKKLDQLIGHAPSKVKFGAKTGCGFLASLRCGSNFKYSHNFFSYLTFQIFSELKIIFGGFGVKQIMAFVCFILLRRTMALLQFELIQSHSTFFLISSVQISSSQLLRNSRFFCDSRKRFFPRDEKQLFCR
jgi:hypothetical protein